MKITAGFQFSTSHCLTVGDLRTFDVLRIVLSLGAELMSSTLAVKLLWKAAVFDVILINTLYLYVALWQLYHSTLSVSDLRIKDTVLCLRFGFENLCKSNYVLKAPGNLLLKMCPAGHIFTELGIVLSISIGAL